jgi:Tol biopolymer transport system component
VKRFLLLLLLLLNTLPVAAQNDTLLLYTTQADGVVTVGVLNPDTGEATRITELVDELGYSWGDVGWSPDGRYLWVVDIPNQNRRRLRLYEVGNWSETTITENGFLYGCDPALDWSPDGQTLSYFTGEEPDHQLALLHLSDDVTHTYDEVRPPSQGGGEPVWSPDGRYVLIADSVVDTADMSVTMEFDAPYWSTGFSPDGRFFAYSEPNISSTPVWLYDLAANELLDTGTPGTIDRWSPDGRYLLFERRDEQQEVVHFYYELETGRFEAIDVGKPIRNFAGWFQGGEELLVATLRDESGQSLLRYEMASGNVTPVTEAPGSVMRVVTDGPWLVVAYSSEYERGEHPSDLLWLTDGETVLEAELIIHSDHFTNAEEVAWSPDRRWLSVVASDGIYRFDPQTAALDRLPVDAHRFEVPMWSPDSRYLVFHAYLTEESDSRETMLWNTETDTIEPIEHEIGTLIGWRNGETQDSLLYCGIG